MFLQGSLKEKSCLALKARCKKYRETPPSFLRVNTTHPTVVHSP